MKFFLDPYYFLFLYRSYFLKIDLASSTLFSCLVTPFHTLTPVFFFFFSLLFLQITGNFFMFQDFTVYHSCQESFLCRRAAVRCWHERARWREERRGWVGGREGGRREKEEGRERNGVWGPCAFFCSSLREASAICLALAPWRYGRSWRRGLERGRRQLKPWTL